MSYKKRICLFAAYDKNNIVHDYVVYYVKELSKFADIYYLAECNMPQRELDKLKPYVKEAYAYKHGKYDFGSWQELIYKIGWKRLSQYDELILANDSCFAPVFPLEPIFEKATLSNCDFWGITEGRLNNLHIQSYFMVLNKKCFTSKVFKDFISSVTVVNKEQLIDKYESRLTALLTDNGFVCKKLLNGSIGAYDKYITMLRLKNPFIKKLSFTEKDKYHLRQSLVNWEKYFNKYTNYDINLIKNYLKSANLPDTFFKSNQYKKQAFKYNLKALCKWIFEVRLSKKHTLVRFFGITIADKYKNSIDTF